MNLASYGPLVKIFILATPNKSSVAAEMGDRLATINMGQKVGLL